MKETIDRAGYWPCCFPALRSVRSLRTGPYHMTALLNDREYIAVTHDPHGMSHIRQSFNPPVSVPTALIQSIEHHTLAEYHGRAPYQGEVLIDEDPPGTARMIEAMGLHPHEVRVAFTPGGCVSLVAVILAALSAYLATFIVGVGFMKAADLLVEALTGIELGYMEGKSLLSVIVRLELFGFMVWAAFSAGRHALRRQRRQQRVFVFDEAQMFLVVLYLADGRRFIVASAYRDMDLLTRMLADHRNLLDRAKARLVQPQSQDEFI